jgi:hypothetical protein
MQPQLLPPRGGLTLAAAMPEDADERTPPRGWLLPTEGRDPAPTTSRRTNRGTGANPNGTGPSLGKEEPHQPEWCRSSGEAKVYSDAEHPL